MCMLHVHRQQRCSAGTIPLPHYRRCGRRQQEITGYSVCLRLSAYYLLARLSSSALPNVRPVRLYVELPKRYVNRA